MKPGRQRGKAVGVKYALPMTIEVEAQLCKGTLKKMLWKDFLCSIIHDLFYKKIPFNF